MVAYLGSIREPVLRYIGEPLDFDAVLGEVAARVEEVIRERVRSGPSTAAACSTAGDGVIADIQYSSRSPVTGSMRSS